MSSAAGQTPEQVSWGEVVRTALRLIFFRVSQAEGPCRREASGVWPGQHLARRDGPILGQSASRSSATSGRRLSRLGELDWFSIISATMSPLTLIVVTLTLLNLEKAVFNIMGGIREPTARDASYGLLFLLSQFSVLIFIPVVICYLVMAIVRLVEFLKQHRRAKNES